jgi:RNA polymerase sigma-70 factor, ECF subfamily
MACGPVVERRRLARELAAQRRSRVGQQSSDDARGEVTPAVKVMLLEEQDRTFWDRAMIEEGEALLTATLAEGRPGPLQLWAAIAACHSTAADASQTDWRQISLLYSELLVYEPSPVVEANRAIAVAMAEGPAAGLTILDVIVKDPQLSTWPAIHIARADLLARAGRNQPAIDAYRTALELEPVSPERAFISRRIRILEGL